MNHNFLQNLFDEEKNRMKIFGKMCVIFHLCYPIDYNVFYFI